MTERSKEQQAREDRLTLVFDELRRAEATFPGWPDNAFEGLAIVGEELGEAQKAALDATYGRGSWKSYHKELIHLAAMSLRILFNVEEVKLGRDN